MYMFSIISNIAFLIPIVIAYRSEEYIYYILASLVFLVSSMYHWYSKNKPSTIAHILFRVSDWFIAILCYLYMYWFVWNRTPSDYRFILTLLLSSTIALFAYSFWGGGNYRRIHPWFHIYTGIVSGLIVWLAN